MGSGQSLNLWKHLQTHYFSPFWKTSLKSPHCCWLRGCRADSAPCPLSPAQPNREPVTKWRPAPHGAGHKMAAGPPWSLSQNGARPHTEPVPTWNPALQHVANSDSSPACFRPISTVYSLLTNQLAAVASVLTNGGLQKRSDHMYKLWLKLSSSGPTRSWLQGGSC